jgi:hypothetical protein
VNHVRISGGHDGRSENQRRGWDGRAHRSAWVRERNGLVSQEDMEKWGRRKKNDGRAYIGKDDVAEGGLM